MRLSVIGSASVQAYTALIGLFILPYYLRLMGDEAFGLVGIFLLVQSLIQLLDFGITPTCSRQVALFKSGTKTSTEVWANVRPIETLMLFSCIGVVALGWAFKRDIAEIWFTSKHFTGSYLGNCLFLMIFSGAIRWLAGIYRGTLFGLEKHTTFNLLTAAITTLRFVCVIPFMIYVETSILTFLYYQAFLAVVELLVFGLITYSSIPGIMTRLSPDKGEFRALLALAKSTGILSVIWIISNNIDKAILSKLLNLNEFGRVSLAISAASALYMLLPLLNQVVQPRYTVIAATQPHCKLVDFHYQVSIVLSAVLVTAAIAAAMNSEPLLLLWINDSTVVSQISLLFSLYIFANALSVVTLPAFLIQFAQGNIDLHVKGNIVFLLLSIPTIFLAAIWHGATGLAWTLVVSRLLYLSIWITKVHRQILTDKEFMAFLGKHARVITSAALLTSTASWLFSHLQSDILRLISLIPTSIAVIILSLYSTGSISMRSLLSFGKFN